MNDLDLSALADGPVPPLAAAAHVRARGEQRRRRSHALVAGAAALVVAIGAGTAVALAERGKPDALVPAAPTPTPAPVATTAAYLLTPEDAARVTDDTWHVERVVDDSRIPLVPCPTGDSSAGSGARRSLVRGTEQVTSHVLVQPDAEAWVQGLKQEVLRCPRSDADAEEPATSNSYELVDVARGLMLAWPVTAVRHTYRDCDTCQARVRLWTVVGYEDLLSFTSVPATEEPRLLPWAHAARDRLVPDTSSSATPTPAASQDDALSSDDSLRIDRIGPVVVGMTLQQARAAAQQELRQEGDDLGGCVYYRPRSGEPDVSFMVIRGVVSRIDVDSGTTTTVDGIGIGATEAEVKATYPSAVVSKHYYTDGHYLRVLSKDGRHAFLFETDGTKVLNFRSGYPDAVDQVEGCA